MKPLLLLAAIATASSASAQQANSFDLVCEGTRVDARTNAKTPWTGRIHVDLAQKVSCDARCTEKRPLIERSTELILQSQDDLEGKIMEGVERTTGRYVKTVVDSSQAWGILGSCEKAPYTGPKMRKF